MLAAVSAVRSQPSKTIVKFRVVCKDGSTPSMRTVLMPLDEVNEAALMDAFNLNENQHIITEASFMGQRSDNLEDVLEYADAVTRSQVLALTPDNILTVYVQGAAALHPGEAQDVASATKAARGSVAGRSEDVPSVTIDPEGRWRAGT